MKPGESDCLAVGLVPALAVACPNVITAPGLMGCLLGWGGLETPECTYRARSRHICTIDSGAGHSPPERSCSILIQYCDDIQTVLLHIANFPPSGLIINLDKRTQRLHNRD